MSYLGYDLPEPAGTNLHAIVATISGTLSSLSVRSTPEELKTTRSNRPVKAQ
jgi:hypothetical protein